MTSLKHLVLACILGFLVPVVQAAKSNIVLILADDMGYGDCMVNSPESKIPTPHLDRFAGEGRRFTGAHSAAVVCNPSRYGLLAGTNPALPEISKATAASGPIVAPEEPTITDLGQSWTGKNAVQE